MAKSDRIFGLIMLLVAAGYIFAAAQARSGFMSDPVGPRAFPILVGAVAMLCSLFMVFRPDPDPQWPGMRATGAIAVAVVVLTAYAYGLKPLGFLIPTFFAASVLSYQLSGRPVAALLSGLGLAWGLFIMFKFILDLGLVGISEGASPYLPFIQPIIDVLDTFFGWLGSMLPDFRPERAPTSGGD